MGLRLSLENGGRSAVGEIRGVVLGCAVVDAATVEDALTVEDFATLEDAAKVEDAANIGLAVLLFGRNAIPER